MPRGRRRSQPGFVLDDPTMPHQIHLVFASKQTTCVDGTVAFAGDVLVTCNCYRIGNTRRGGFRSFMAIAPTVPHAWRAWNRRSLHDALARSTFEPNEEMIRTHGIQGHEKETTR